jgi:penicillin-binding protein 2
MALALLKAGVDPKRIVVCNRTYPLGNHIFHCDQRHGPVNMEDAVVKSCDIYFYDSCRRVGVNAFAPLIKEMGFGEKFDLPFDFQRYGTVPDPEWMERRYHREWQTYDTINMSIGQGNVLINPLQLAIAGARVASGRRVVPRLMRQGGQRAFAPLDIPPEDLEFVRRAMAGVVDHGTAAASKMPLDTIQMAGKTGTAQVRRITMAERAGGVLANESLAWRMRDHSLFMAFAPANAPRYAAAAIIEHGGFGAQVAAPLVRDTLLFLFDRPKAMAALQAFEQSLGGTLAERVARKNAAWRAANGLPPLPITQA